MKTNIYARVFGLFLSVSVATASASDKDKVSVEASSDLRVIVIDSSESSASRTTIHSAFSTALSMGMTRECKAPVQVKMKVAEAARAAKELKNGSCDVVVVIGNSVPSALMKSDTTVLKATDARSGSLNRTFYLLAHTRDPAMNQLVSLAFDHAIKSTPFQDALAGKSTSAAGLAAATR